MTRHSGRSTGHRLGVSRYQLPSAVPHKAALGILPWCCALNPLALAGSMNHFLSPISISLPSRTVSSVIVLLYFASSGSYCTLSYLSNREREKGPHGNQQKNEVLRRQQHGLLPLSPPDLKRHNRSRALLLYPFGLPRIHHNMGVLQPSGPNPTPCLYPSLRAAHPVK